MGIDLADDLAENLADDLATSLAGTEVPETVSGLYSWLRGDSVTLNGSDLESLLDKSGNSRHASQSDPAKQAAYTASDAGYNNQPTFTFNGTSDLYEADWLATLLNSGAAFTAFVVHGQGSGTSDLFSGGLSSSTGVYVRFGRLGTGELFTQRHNGTAETDSAATAIGTANYSALSYGGSSNPGDIYLDGTVDLDEYTSAQDPSTMDQGAIGCLRRNTDGNFWGAKMAELIFYNRRLSNAEIDTVNAYLAARYGL